MKDSGTEILAVVPARAGSKGIHRKNLAVVRGRSLIARACLIAGACKRVDSVVISSDDEEMGREGLAHGADVFVQRPAILATDRTTAADAWCHAWVAAEKELGRTFAVSVLLQPTSPTRTCADVEAAIEAVLASGANSSVTLSPVPKHFSPEKLLAIDSLGHARPFIPGAIPNQRRQDVEDAYWLNGHCYAARREAFMRDRIVITDDAQAVVISRTVANIDEPDDLLQAEEILAEREVENWPL